MTFPRITLLDAAFVLVFSLALSSSSLKTHSFLSGADYSLKFYLVLGLVSVATFSIFLWLFAAFRAWIANAAPQRG